MGYVKICYVYVAVVLEGVNLHPLVLRVGRSYMNARGEFTSFTSLR
jgi:hypothetical protein